MKRKSQNCVETQAGFQTTVVKSYAEAYTKFSWLVQFRFIFLLLAMDLISLIVASAAVSML